MTHDVEVYEGLEYYIRVSAENDAGQGQPCEAIGPLLAEAPAGMCSMPSVLGDVDYSAVVQKYTINDLRGVHM